VGGSLSCFPEMEKKTLGETGVVENWAGIPYRGEAKGAAKKKKKKKKTKKEKKKRKKKKKNKKKNNKKKKKKKKKKTPCLR